MVIFVCAEFAEDQAVAFVGFGAFFDALVEKMGSVHSRRRRQEEAAISSIAPCSTSSAGLRPKSPSDPNAPLAARIAFDGRICICPSLRVADARKRYAVKCFVFKHINLVTGNANQHRSGDHDSSGGKAVEPRIIFNSPPKSALTLNAPRLREPSFWVYTARNHERFSCYAHAFISSVWCLLYKFGGRKFGTAGRRSRTEDCR